MYRVLAICLLALAAALPAQPVLDRETARAIPLDAALVLEPIGPWHLWPLQRVGGETHVAGLAQEDGVLRMTVAESGKCAFWYRTLAIPCDPDRYPVVALVYRATGTQPSSEPLLRLDGAKGQRLAVFENGALIPDGKVHELFADLRELEPRSPINRVFVGVHCQGPEPAVFELLALRFESDGGLPPPETRDGPELSLRVVDTEDKAVPGATVTVDPDWLNASRTAVTDAEGRVTVRALPHAVGEHTMRIAKEGMATVLAGTSKKRGLPELVAMFPAVRYGGVVQNEDKEPIAGVSVHLGLYGGGPKWAGPYHQPAVVLTNGEGRWQSPPLPRGEFTVKIELFHPDYAPTEAKGSQATDLLNGTAVLTMESGACLGGRVVDPQGKPVAGVRLALAKEMYDPDKETTPTDGDGRFAFSRRLLGRRVLAVVPEGYAPQRIVVQMATHMADLEVKLDPGVPLRGRIVDRDGKPIEGVSVWRESGMSIVPWRSKTDADGRFLWPHAPAGESSSLVVSKKGYMTFHYLRVLPGDEEVQVVLPPVLQVSGTVTDATTGKPIPEFTVTPGRIFPRSRGRRWYWQENQTKSWRDGHYTLTFSSSHDRGEEKGLKVSAPGYMDATALSIPMDAGECEVNLQLRPGTGVMGTILRPDGKPAAGAQVCLVQAGQKLKIEGGQHVIPGEHMSTTTGEDGGYSFPIPKVDNWRLVAIHPDGYVEQDAPAHAKSPDATLLPWATAEGVFRVGAGPAPKVILHARTERSPEGYDRPKIRHEYETRTDEEGRFTIRPVPPGTVLCVGGPVRDGGEEPLSSIRVGFPVAPGQILRITLGGTGRPVIGRLALPEGETRPVHWDSALGVLNPRVEVDVKAPEMPAQFRDLPPQEGMARLQEWLKTDASKAYREAEIRYARAYSAARMEAPTHTIRVRPDGSFRIEDVVPGSYGLMVSTRTGLTGHASLRFSMPEIPGGRSDEPLDVGTLTLKLRE
jgi:hypothetical protein